VIDVSATAHRTITASKVTYTALKTLGEEQVNLLADEFQHPADRWSKDGLKFATMILLGSYFCRTPRALTFE